MSTIYKTLSISFAAVLFAGCVNLDTVPLTSYVTEDQKAAVLESDPSRAEAGVVAIFSNFTQYGATLGTDYHNDFGYPAIMMFTDSRGTDMVTGDIGYNWFSTPLEFADCLSTSSVPALMWATLYNQIFTANAVLGSIDPEAEDATSQYYRAQAYAVRAFDYFVLAQLFQFSYVGNETMLGVPIITEENSETVSSEGCARATLEETYEQVLSDIDTAIVLLSDSSVRKRDKRFVGLDVAYGIRARVNLVMQNWAEAVADAESALDETTATPYSLEQASHPAFVDIEDNSWMWGVLITDQDDVSTSVICNFASHMGSFNYGYASVGAWRRIGVKLYNQIPVSDVRKGWFLDANKVSMNLTSEEQTYMSDSGAPEYCQVKFAAHDGELGTSSNDNDVPLMRVEEMYLIQAEALAMSGNTADAVAKLNSFVQTYRNPSYNCTATSPEDIQEAIWMQRRMEFWGEGLSWFDIMRLNKGVDRRGNGFDAANVFNIEAGSQVLVYPIPYSEEQYNPLMQGNPSASIPTAVADTEE